MAELWRWVLDRGNPEDDYWVEAAGLEDVAEGIDSVFAAAVRERAASVARSPPPDAPEVPPHLRITVTKAEAGQLLGGKSVDWVEDHVMGDIRTIRKGASVLIRVRDLEDWADHNAARALR